MGAKCSEAAGRGCVYFEATGREASSMCYYNRTLSGNAEASSGDWCYDHAGIDKGKCNKAAGRGCVYSEERSRCYKEAERGNMDAKSGYGCYDHAGNDGCYDIA